MTRPVGIVRNPKSRRNLGRPAADAGRLGPHVILREPRSQDELRRACAEFAESRIGLLAIDGGDGTVRDTLSAAADVFADLPPLAFLASGKTNILKPTSGSWGTGETALSRLAAAAATGFAGCATRRVASLRVSTSAERRIGFVFGAGAYARAVALADEGLADRIHFGPARIAANIGRAVVALSQGRERERWLSGVPLRLGIDGIDEPAVRPRFIFLATTLERFTLGIWPFWNANGDRRLRWLDVDAPPTRFGAALWPVLRGRPKPWMSAAGYRSGAAGRLTFLLEAPFVLDGEAYVPGSDGMITVEQGPELAFVAP